MSVFAARAQPAFLRCHTAAPTMHSASTPAVTLAAADDHRHSHTGSDAVSASDQLKSGVRIDGIPSGFTKLFVRMCVGVIVHCPGGADPHVPREASHPGVAVPAPLVHIA